MTDQETYASVDKLMLLDHCNGCYCGEGWCCTNQLIRNTNFHNLKEQNQFKINFKPNLICKMSGSNHPSTLFHTGRQTVERYFRPGRGRTFRSPCCVGFLFSHHIDWLHCFFRLELLPKYLRMTDK